MRLGPLEIVLIIIVVIFVALITRILGPMRSRASAARKEPGSPRQARNFLSKTGFAFTIAGVLGLVAVGSLFRWVLQGFLWALIVIAVIITCRSHEEHPGIFGSCDSIIKRLRKVGSSP